MPRPTPAPANCRYPAAGGGKHISRSGLTRASSRPDLDELVVFGSPAQQQLLVRLFRDGPQPTTLKASLSRLLRAGLVVRFQDRGHWTLALDPRHPAFDALCGVLHEMSGSPRAATTLPRTLPPATVEPLYALGHHGRAAFRVLLQTVLAGEPVDVGTLRRRLPDLWPSSVADNVEMLFRDGVLTRWRGGNVSLASGLPTALPRFLLQTAEAFAALEPRLAEHVADRGSQPAAFVAAGDGAPRLFGTDVRLRNLMALAVHGPLLRRELRRITGTGHLHLEDRDEAPFGRGALVRVWETDLGPAVMLDRDHPLYLPLRRLLVALERVYPLPAYVREFKAPKLPSAQAWAGDRLALFGSAFPTKILMTLAGRGWTFEAVCCESHSKDDGAGNRRVLTKKVIRRLEAEGVLEGSRPRGPGFGPRLLRIADAFRARVELQALIDAIPAAWPDLGDRIEAAFAAIPEKTKTYFQKRGIRF